MRLVSYSSWESLPTGYDRLFEHGASQSFFLSRPWFTMLHRSTFESGDKPCLLGVESDSEPVALLVGRTPAGQNGSIFEGRRIGRRTLASMSNYQTCLFAPLLSPAHDRQAALRNLIGGIGSQTPAWTLIDLNPLDRSSVLFDELHNEFRAAGMLVEPYYYTVCRYEPIGGRTYDQYFKERPEIIREVSARKARRLEREHRVKVEIITTSADAERGVELYSRVYGGSWKDPEKYPNFIGNLIRTCANEGVLRLGVFHVDDEPAAAQVWIVSAGHACGYRNDFDERFKSLSVGTVLAARMIRHVIDVDKVQSLDWGLFDETYKQQWLSQCKEMWGLAAYNPRTLRGLSAKGSSALRRILAAGRRKAASAIKRLRRGKQ